MSTLIPPAADGSSLQERNQTEWSQQVELVFEDMRNYVPPVDESQKADLIVSELLGSFGDNEGSPECLDGCMRCLKGTSPSLLFDRS